MSNLILILSPLFIASSFLLSSAATFSDNINNNNVGGSLVRSKQREFDYFALALQWPGTYCRRTRNCCQQNGCCRHGGAPRHFTIHGLWPDYNDGTWPACCTNDNFDMSKISTLSEDLYEYWPTLSCGSTSTCHKHKGPFWAHEWEKHGTCAASVLGDEYGYFQKTLIIYFKYNVTMALSEAGYVPSNSEKYPIGGVRSAIENAFHVSPLIICSGDAIEEIRLCFDKNLKPRDCVNTVKTEVGLSKSSCPKYVSLPTYDNSGLRNFNSFSQVQPDIQAM